jgi:RNA polymerase sigma factor (sigma-70 family)
VTNSEAVETFSVFYRAHYSLILSTVTRRLNDYATAEDVTSEVFRVAWAHHNSGGELTLAWLYVTARNLIGNEYRRASRMAALTTRTANFSDGIKVAPDHEAADMRRAMMRLRDSEREILFMAYWEDLSGSEIAEILGCKVPTVWVRLNRARASLKEELGKSVLAAVTELRERGARAHG